MTTSMCLATFCMTKHGQQIICLLFYVRATKILAQGAGLVSLDHSSSAGFQVH